MLRRTAEVAVLAHADEGLEVVRGHGVAFLCEQRDRRLRQERFRDRQHPVEVENHSSQVGVFHAEAIVFDLDGVLVDKMHVIRAA